MRNHIYAGFLIVFTHISSHSETLTYDFSSLEVTTTPGRSPDIDPCQFDGGKFEKKRRELIDKHGLPRDSKWHMGYIKNEWGDYKDWFCFLNNGNNYYLSFTFKRFWEKSIPDRVVVQGK